VKGLLFVAAATLVLAAPASAKGKEILGLQMCGASGCETEKGPQIGGLLHEGPSGPFASNGVAVPPAQPGPFYRAYALAGDHGKVYGRMPFYYVPGGAAIVQPGMGGQTTTWQTANATWRAALDRLAKKVQPFAAPTITRVSLNSRNAEDPQSYLDLYTIGSKAKTYPKHPESIQVVLESKRRTPWTDGNYIVLYPKDRLLVRDGLLVTIPGDVADAAAAGRSLDLGRSFPWLAVAVAGAVALLVAAAMLLARRLPARGQRPVPQA
jgi:hypothetical protein